MTVGDIIDWPVEFGPIDAEIECRPVDIKAISNAVFRDSAAILGVTDAGVWIRSEAVRQGAHAHCPAEAFPEFECSTAGAVAVYPSQVATLRSATLSTDPVHVSVSLHGERLTMDANGFGGTVPTVIPVRDTGQHQRIADFAFRSIHAKHTAEARVSDLRFEDFLDWNADYPDAKVALTPDGASITDSSGHAHWTWGESTGSGEATYRGQEFLDVFDQFYLGASTTRFAWGDDETVAMIFRGDSWHMIGYVIPAPDSSTNTAQRQVESGTATRRCPNVEVGSSVFPQPGIGRVSPRSAVFALLRRVREYTRFSDPVLRLLCRPV